MLLKRFFLLLLVCADFESNGAAAGGAWENGKGFRRAPVSIAPGGKVGFTQLSPQSLGMHWTNRVSAARYAERQNLMNGSGLALGDFDGDGRCDIYLCNKEGANALYRNLGNWKFEDVAESAGVTCTNQSSTGATFADINGDGRIDLLVNSFAGPNACFLNLGNGRFTNITAAAGLVSKGGTTSMALGDIDGDGDLDLYVNYFGIEAILRDGGAYATRMVNGKPIVTGRYAKRLAIMNGRLVEFGEPDVLFRNNGQGHFTPLEWKEIFRDEDGRPMAAPWDFGLAVQIRDINGDGFPDIYVCNDFQTPDRLWLNDGKGNFKAIERLAVRNMSYASMGADFADIDRDGRLDFFAVEMLSRDHTRLLNQSSPMTPLPRVLGMITDREEVARNTLYWNRGDNTYAEIAYSSGLAASDWSWTPIFIDVDLDGFEDVLVSNGHMRDVNDRDVAATRNQMMAERKNTKDVLMLYPPLNTPNAAYRNNGDLTFTDCAKLWGFDSREICHGMALADLDNDGDQDVVVNPINAPPLVYRNDCPAARVAVRLKGRAPNTQGIGGKISVTGGPTDQTQEIICGSRYLAGDDTLRTFASIPAKGKLRIEVVWRNGSTSVVENVEPNYVYEIDEAQASGQRAKGKMEDGKGKMFEDVSHMIAHRHVEEAYDDFARQPLLPRRLSQLGPGAAWFDLDGDGWDELIVGSGKGGTPAVFKNDGRGGLKREAFGTNAPLPDDSTAMIGWASGNGRRSLLLGLASYESNATDRSPILRIESSGAAVSSTDILPDQSSPGPVIMADIDGDGDLDLFIGGRVVPGRYPESAASKLFINDKGVFSPDAEACQRLAKVGLVSGAVFSDLDNDGAPELVLACEWGPIRVFKRAGKFQEITRDVGLEDFTGLWNSVASGDFNGDGKLDLIAGNLGSNSFYNRAPKGPWRIYFGDWNGDGQVQLLDAYFNAELQKMVPWRDMTTISSGIPWVRERFASHKAYAQAGVDEILGDRISKATHVEANTVQSLVLLNRGDRFEPVPLPVQAQWAPAFGLNVADLDGDGNEDLFVSQNFFAVRTEDNRLDAGRGLWLRGNGRGGFEPVAGHQARLKVYGEQRGSALADYDADGRVDLVVTQNGAETKLFRNVGAKPGLRIRLRGPAGNPDGIGAAIRLVFGEKMSPLREIRSGSGYWSQDSAVQVMSGAEVPASVWVRWPGGKTTTTPLSSDAREVSISADGEIKVLR